MPDTLTAEERERREKARQRISAMLEKVNRPVDDSSVTPGERITFREHADRLMAQYGFTEEECRPQERVDRNAGWGSDHTWFSEWIAKMAEEARRNDEEVRRRQQEARARAKAHRARVTSQILFDLQAKGEGFVPDELVNRLDRGIETFLTHTIAGWEVTSEYDSARSGYWIRTKARQFQRDQEKAQQKTWRAYRQPGTTPDSSVMDEFATFMDGVGGNAYAAGAGRTNYDHRFCEHEGTPAARARCRRERRGY